MRHLEAVCLAMTNYHRTCQDPNQRKVSLIDYLGYIVTPLITFNNRSLSLISVDLESLLINIIGNVKNPEIWYLSMRTQAKALLMQFEKYLRERDHRVTLVLHLQNNAISQQFVTTVLPYAIYGRND